MTNHHAGSATGIDLAKLADEWDALSITFAALGDDISLAEASTMRVNATELRAALARATPQHSVTEQADWPAGYAAWLRNTSKPPFDNDQRPPADAFKAGAEWARAQPLASTAATQPEQADEVVRDVATLIERDVAELDYAGEFNEETMLMVHVDDLRRICIRHIAALAIPASTAPSAPIRLSEEHPNLKVPTDPACSAKLDELGDDRDQGLDPYWKFGFRTGWHHGVRSLTASTAASEQQASVSEAGERELYEAYAAQQPQPALRWDQLSDYAKNYWLQRALSGRATIPSEADERMLKVIHELTSSSMRLAADLVQMADHEFNGNSYLLRDPVMERVVRWRTEWNATAPDRAALTHRATTAADQQGAAQAQAGDDARDAARYRWLRSAHDIPHGSRAIPWVVQLDPKEKMHTIVPCREGDLDCAIDAAMAAPATSNGSKA